jgi:hypothetical protein
MYLIIEVNHGFSGSMDFDIECYCSFNIQNRQRQSVWTLMLSRILGDIK